MAPPRGTPKRAGSPAAPYRLALRVRPAAHQSRTTSYDGAVLRLDLAAPPTDNRANVELIQLLAAELGLAPSRFQLIHGQTGRNKLVAIDAPAEVVEAWLARLGH